MRYLVVVVILVVSVMALAFTQSEINILKYQLQMPNIYGNACGLRMVGSLEEGAFGLVWKLDKNSVMFTGQVLGYNSVFKKWLETGVFEWSKVYFDVFLLWRF